MEAITTPEVAVPTEEEVKPQRSLFCRANWWALLYSVLFLLLFQRHSTAIGNHPDPNVAYGSTPPDLWTVGLVVIAVYWVVALAVFIFSTVRVLHNGAFAYIPTPAEIDAQLRAEGYNPTLQDVLLVEQRLKSERNESAVLLGAFLIGTSVLANQAKGK